MIFYGTTDFMSRRKKHESFVDVTRIKEMQNIFYYNQDNEKPKDLKISSEEDNVLVLGAAVVFSDLYQFFLKEKDKTENKQSKHVFSVLIDSLFKFYTNQVRNGSSLGGNWMRSDLTPLLLALDAKALVASLETSKEDFKVIPLSSIIHSKREQRDLVVNIIISWNSKQSFFLYSTKNGFSIFLHLFFLEFFYIFTLKNCFEFQDLQKTDSFLLAQK
jgi:CO/xanthine dehydrogenase FAD-binding subunit